MNARKIRASHAILPSLSPLALSGVAAGVATLLLPLVVLGPTSAPWTSFAATEAAAPPDATDTRASGPADQSRQQAITPTRQPPSRPIGSPPQIEHVAFAPGPLTAARDLRLEIHATDPDGDLLKLRTVWKINGREFETTTPWLPKANLRRGSEITAQVIASDGSRESTPFVTETVRIGNAAPLITTFPAGFDSVGRFVYPIAAIDPDGDHALEYHLATGPAGMTIEPQVGTLRWQPAFGQNGRHTVRVEVRDGHGGLQLQSFDLHVRRRHLAPAGLASHIALP